MSRPFWIRVATAGGDECWPWTGAKSKGYGHFWDGERVVKAHRYAYEALRGPIPDGLSLDHLCRNRACCNPFHLEPVTRGENVLRGESPHVVLHREGVCKQGHPMVGANRRRRSNGRHECVACGIERSRIYQAELRRKRQREAAGVSTPDRP